MLVLGLAIVAGSWRSEDGIMRFTPRLPNDTATLLLLAVFLIVLLGLSDQLGDNASEHQVEISVVDAILLLSVYGAWLWSYLRAPDGHEPAVEHPPHAVLPSKPAIALLAIAGVAAALTSEWFVHAIDPAVEALGISKAFTGLVIVAIAGNAVENVVASPWRRRARPTWRSPSSRPPSRRSQHSSSRCSCSRRSSSTSG